ncbi:hypothetical protein RCL1_005298 [Eukaryota sp. TZLM3-RCL]
MQQRSHLKLEVSVNTIGQPIISDIVRIHNYDWKIRVELGKYTAVNNTNTSLSDDVAFFLSCHQTTSCEFDLHFTIKNTVNPFILKTKRQFQAGSDWGYTSFIKLSTLLDQRAGYVSNGKITFLVYIVAPTSQSVPSLFENAVTDQVRTIPKTLTHVHQQIYTLEKIWTEALLSDFQIHFNEKTYNVHKAVLFGISNRLDVAISCGDSELTISTSLDVRSDVLRDLLRSFYGTPLTIDNSNAAELLLLSWDLDMSFLFEKIKTSIAQNTSSSHKLDVHQIFQKLNANDFKNYTLKFKGVEVRVHKFLVAAFCDFFRIKWSRQWENQELDYSDFTMMLTIDPECFKSFFNSLYREKVDIGLSYVFDYYHLSQHFGLSSLLTEIKKFISSTVALDDWIFSSLQKASIAEDLTFIDVISLKLNEIQNLKEKKPLQLKHEVCQKLAQLKVSPQWVISCIVDPFVSGSPLQNWRPQHLRSCLEAINVSTISVHEVYQTILPLTKKSETISSIMPFSLKVMSHFQARSPHEWVRWVILTINSSLDGVHMQDFASSAESILNSNMLESIGVFSVTPRFLKVLLQRASSSHLVTYLLKCMVKSYNGGNMTKEVLEQLLNQANLTRTTAELVFNAISPLMADLQIGPILHKYVATVLFPKIVKERSGGVFRNAAFRR